MSSINTLHKEEMREESSGFGYDGVTSIIIYFFPLTSRKLEKNMQADLIVLCFADIVVFTN